MVPSTVSIEVVPAAPSQGQSRATLTSCHLSGGKALNNTHLISVIQKSGAVYCFYGSGVTGATTCHPHKLPPRKRTHGINQIKFKLMMPSTVSMAEVPAVPSQPYPHKLPPKP